MRYIIIILLTFTFISCKDNRTASSSGIDQPTSHTTGKSNYASIPVADIKVLWNEATHMDYIFHELPFSINMSDLPSIRQHLDYIANEPVTYDLSNCKSLGRAFFTVGGNTAYEAEIYFSPNCFHYVWHVDGKPAYANAMSPAGIEFYKNLINQVVVEKPDGQKE